MLAIEHVEPENLSDMSGSLLELWFTDSSAEPPSSESAQAHEDRADEEAIRAWRLPAIRLSQSTRPPRLRNEVGVLLLTPPSRAWHGVEAIACDSAA